MALCQLPSLVVEACFLLCHNSPSPFAFTENFIIKGSPSHEIFVLFPILLTASHHLQSKDEICVEFIKEYIVDCKSILFSPPPLTLL